jgi:hypothetical protein
MHRQDGQTIGGNSLIIPATLGCVRCPVCTFSSSVKAYAQTASRHATKAVASAAQAGFVEFV